MNTQDVIWGIWDRTKGDWRRDEHGNQVEVWESRTVCEKKAEAMNAAYHTKGRFIRVRA